MPGRPDFIAEAERILGVLDGAILVVSADEGVHSRPGASAMRKSASSNERQLTVLLRPGNPMRLSTQDGDLAVDRSGYGIVRSPTRGPNASAYWPALEDRREADVVDFGWLSKEFDASVDRLADR